MDCLRSRGFLRLAAMVFLGVGGCSDRSHLPLTSSKATLPADKSAQVEITSAKGKNKDLPKRQPKALTCVAFGDFRMREARVPGRTPQEQRQMWEQARRAYLQALEIDPTCLAAHRGLGQAHNSLGEYSQAVAAYQAGLQNHPNEAALWMELGMLHSRQKDWRSATEAMGRAVELEPRNQQFAHMLGFGLARMGAYEESLACFRRVDGEAQAHYNVARMARHMKHDDVCRQHLQLAVQKDPNLKPAHEMLADLQRGQQGSTEGIVPVQFQSLQR